MVYVVLKRLIVIWEYALMDFDFLLLEYVNNLWKGRWGEYKASYSKELC